MVSGRNYMTLSLAYVIKKILFQFFERQTSNHDEKELKDRILEKMVYYLDVKICAKQKKMIMVGQRFNF